MPRFGRYVALLLLVALTSPMARASAPSAATADFTDAQVIDVMRRAADYQLAEQAKTRPNVGWVRATFYVGLMAAYETTKDQKYLDAAIAWSEAGNWAPEPRKATWRHADDVLCGSTYLSIYDIKKDPRMIAAIRERTHWNMANITPKDPVTLGLTTQRELDAAVAKAAKAAGAPAPVDTRFEGDRDALIEQLRREREQHAREAEAALAGASDEALRDEIVPGIRDPFKNTPVE